MHQNWAQTYVLIWIFVSETIPESRMVYENADVTIELRQQNEQIKRNNE